MLLSRRASGGAGNSLLEINVTKQLSNWRNYQSADNCLIWLTTSIPSSTAAHCGSKVKQRGGFSPPIAPQRHMMLVGEDPLPAQNGSSPCSGQPSALLFAQQVTTPPLKIIKDYLTDSGLNCLLFPVETSFLVVTGWNESCGRFWSFWWLDNYIGDSLSRHVPRPTRMVGGPQPLEDMQILLGGDIDQLPCTPRMTAIARQLTRWLKFLQNFHPMQKSREFSSIIVPNVLRMRFKRKEEDTIIKHWQMRIKVLVAVLYWDWLQKAKRQC